MNNPLKYVDPTGLYNIKDGTVEKGDTLRGITKELNNYFGTNNSVDDYVKMNGISDPDKI